MGTRTNLGSGIMIRAVSHIIHGLTGIAAATSTSGRTELKKARQLKKNIENPDQLSHKVFAASLKSFENYRDAFVAKLQQLRSKKSLSAKLLNFLDSKLYISLGELGTIRRIYKKYDDAMALASQKNLVNPLQEQGFLAQKELSDDEKKVEEGLLRKKLKAGESNKRVIIFQTMPQGMHCLSFKCLAPKGSNGESTGHVSYRGNDDEGKPIFCISRAKFGGGYQEELVVGIELLKARIAFPNGILPADANKNIMNKDEKLKER
jgi:hypothetical protein